MLTAASRRRFWSYVVLWSVVAGSLLLETVSARPALAPIEVGYRDFSFPTGVGGNSAPTGEKPESKLWWHDGFWWGSLWSTAGNAYHIFRLNLVTQAWVDTGTLLDDRKNSRADTLWDGQHLYVVSHLFAENGAPAPPGQQGELYRYSYNSGTKRYSLDAGFPVVVTDGKSETLVLVKDSTGTLWVTYVEDQKVMVNHSSNGDDKNWGSPFVLPVGGAGNLTADDISSIVAFNGRVGLMWSNQNTMKMYFAAHTDGAPANSWQSVIAYTTSADDHISLKSLASDSAGSLFAVVKTSLSSSLVVLLACSSGAPCTAAGNWSSYVVYGSDTYKPTRPILLIDTADRLLYVFTSNQAADGTAAIYYKSTSMDNIQFPAGIGVPFIRSATDTKIDNPSSTKQNLNSLTGLVVLASDASTKYYFHNSLGGTSPPIPPGDEVVFLPFIRRSP